MTESTPQAEPSATQEIVNSTTLVIGASGSGKSSLLYTLMVYVWEEYQKVTLYYLFDGGGFPTQIQALINRGICRLWRCRSRSGEGLAPETIQRAAAGWWPRKINPKTGEAAPTVELVPPVSETFEMVCPNGHLVKTVAFQAQLTPQPCPTCKVAVGPTNMKVTRASRVTKGFETVGARMYDGVSSAASWLLDDLSHRNLGGENSRLGGVVDSGGMRFGENNRAQVGFTQNRAEQWLLASPPGMVIPPVWTALTHETSDEGGLNIRGPLIAGQAKTAVAGQWVGNCIECLVVKHDGKDWRRLALAEFTDEGGVRHLLKTRTPPGTMPLYLEDEVSEDPTAPVFQNFNLGHFHRLLSQVQTSTETAMEQQYPNAPGLDSGDYGEAAAAKPTAPAQVARPAAPPAARPAPPTAQGPRPLPAAGTKPVAAGVTVQPPVATSAKPVAKPPAAKPAVAAAPHAAPPPAAKPPAAAAVPPPPGKRPAAPQA